jgi:histidine triad (HIT) family protein
VTNNRLDVSCVFCGIVLRTASARVVCETDAALAFFPESPAVVGHTLVIPKFHTRDLWSTDPAAAEDLMAAVLRVG